MKSKQHAREKREAGKREWGKKASPANTAVPDVTPVSKLKKEENAQFEVEETKLFLAYLENTDVADKDSVRAEKKKTRIPAINLEDGMPTVEEAITNMKLELQVMKRNKVKIVKLIHGYGSTGKGGKIRIGLQKELIAMKNKRLIKDFIVGEDFGPFSESCRREADQNTKITKDVDYGRCNHGITIVII